MLTLSSRSYHSISSSLTVAGIASGFTSANVLRQNFFFVVDGLALSVGQNGNDNMLQNVWIVPSVVKQIAPA